MFGRNKLDCQVCDCIDVCFNGNRCCAVTTGFFLLINCSDRAAVCLATRKSLAVAGLVNNPS